MSRLEFFPDYGDVLLHANGHAVELEDLGLPADLVGPARAWVHGYDDAKVDPEGWDEGWVSEGRALFQELRAALATRGFEVVDWEGLWSESQDAGPNDGP